jgi:hypothetical protein
VLLGGFSFALFALEIVAAGMIGSVLSNGNDVEGSVEPSIPRRFTDGVVFARARREWVRCRWT